MLKNKKFFLSVLAFLVCISICSVAMAADIFVKPTDFEWITDMGGAVTINGTVNLEEGTAVMLIVAPQILDSEADVTADRIKSAATAEQMRALIEYTAGILVPENKQINHSFNIKKTAPTGMYDVFLSYNGAEDIILIGSFDHINADAIVNAFNSAQATEYAQLVLTDTGTDNVLKRIYADVDGYNAIKDKAAFANLLFELKPESGFDADTLVKGFNQACAWMELREKSDTAEVINKYNKSVWNLPMEAADDFSKLTSEQKNTVYAKLKAWQTADEKILLSAFTEQVGFCSLQNCADREELKELLANPKYSEVFGTATELYASSDLKDYYMADAYNYLLSNKNLCVDKESLEQIVKESIDEAEDKDSGKGGGGSSGGGLGGKGFGSRVEIDTPITPVIPTTPVVEEKHPFKDVANGHWATDYIAELYKKRIVNGITADEFAADASIMRQDFVKLLVTAAGLELSKSKSIFDDVEQGSFYEPYIMTAVENGIVQGIDEKTFGFEKIKREDAAILLCRVLGDKTAESLLTFADSDSISEYALESVQKAAGLGLLKGDENNLVNPKGALSRAEGCALICRLLNILK